MESKNAQKKKLYKKKMSWLLWIKQQKTKGGKKTHKASCREEKPGKKTHKCCVCI